MDFTGAIAKINPFFIISPYFEAENYHFSVNVRACYPLGHLREREGERGGGGQSDQW
jgi:hypothetical protein